MIAQVFLLLFGFVALYFGADWMVRGAARLEGSLGISPIVIGLTVVSLGTSAPELVVAILAALKGSGDLVVGNVLGSNLANIGLILGATAVVRPLHVVERVVLRETPVMLLLTVLLFPLIMDSRVGRVDAVVLSLLLAVYLVYVFHQGRKVPDPLIPTYAARETRRPSMTELLMDAGLVVAGGGALVLGGKAIVEAAVDLAATMGVSELVIGLTVVAVGTSLPELATSLLAAIRNQTDIAVGNIIGSNIFNLTGVLGVSGMANPFGVNPRVLSVEYPAVLMLSILVLLVPFFPRGRQPFLVGRIGGAALLGTYLGLGLWVFMAR